MYAPAKSSAGILSPNQPDSMHSRNVKLLSTSDLLRCCPYAVRISRAWLSNSDQDSSHAAPSRSPLPAVLRVSAGVSHRHVCRCAVARHHRASTLRAPDAHRIRNVRYSLQGIRRHRTFSVNLPSVDMVDVADYCGSVSGATVDKVEACAFTIFYGGLKSAPLIEQCPINMECEVLQFVEVGDHTVIIGSIRETYVTEDCIVSGIPDIGKIQPLCFCTSAPASSGYYCVGEFVASTRSIGNELHT